MRSRPATTLVLLALVLLALVPLAREQPRWLAWGGLATTVGLATLLVLLPTHPRKAFLRDVARLSPGMGEAEVAAVMAAHVAGAGDLTHVGGRTLFAPRGEHALQTYVLLAWEDGRLAAIDLRVD